MVAGAVALFFYSLSAAPIVRITGLSPWAGTTFLWAQWLAVAFALWWLALV
jgi:hypothetical protein